MYEYEIMNMIYKHVHTCPYMTKRKNPKQEQSLLFQVLCILIYATNNR